MTVTKRPHNNTPISFSINFDKQLLLGDIGFSRIHLDLSTPSYYSAYTITSAGRGNLENRNSFSEKDVWYIALVSTMSYNKHRAAISEAESSPGSNKILN